MHHTRNKLLVNDEKKAHPEVGNDANELTLRVSLGALVAPKPSAYSERNCLRAVAIDVPEWLPTLRRLDVPFAHVKRGLNVVNADVFDRAIAEGGSAEKERTTVAGDASKPRKTAADYLRPVGKAGAR